MGTGCQLEDQRSKEFCIAGSINPEMHYFLPKRINWPTFDSFIESQFYFVLHAPRQSGKTTAIREYINHLNSINKYKAFYVSFEPAHNKSSVEQTVFEILEQCKREICLQLPEEKEALDYLTTILATRPISEASLLSFFIFWAQKSPKPLVLFFDEVDGLCGEPLVSFLKQIRTGFPNRPKNFPQTICLVGVRDIREYRIKQRDEYELRTDSPFNITAESIRLPDFTKDDIERLYKQHTAATGQQFTDEAIDYAFYLTQGQPWLVNALAFEACFREILDRKKPITKEIIDKAKKTLILRRDTHLDALLERLSDKRVRVIIDAIICGRAESLFTRDDIDYVRDLGLVKLDEFRIANPIYQEIIPRELSFITQSMIPDKTAWYTDGMGNLQMHKLLERFTQFYRENSIDWLKNFDYKESGPHLLLMAFLQRIMNGCGDIRREYALGNRRVDLLALWKDQKIIIEIKINYGADTLPKGLAQTASYMDTCGATEGHLVIFDKDPSKSWEEKISHYDEQFNGKAITVWLM